jgi:hypothetical protein
MVIWSQYLTDVASFMGVTVSEAGTISALIFTVGVILVGLSATRGKEAMTIIPIVAFFSTLFFTFIGWFPTWTGTMIALVLAIFLAWTFSGLPMGGNS